MSNFLISCGGTGGHLAPGLAIGEALMSRGHKVSFIISEKKIDSRLVEKYSDFKFFRAPGCPFSFNPIKLFKFFYAQAKAIRFALEIFSAEKADAAIVFGGFNSMGLALAAAIRKKPLIIHEANRMPGKAVRFLGKFASRVYVPHGVKIQRRKSGIVRQAGYPIRAEINKLPEGESKKFFGFSENANILLVCGGSQGAAVLNDWAVSNFPELAKNGIDVLCISGPGKLTNTQNEIQDANGVLRKFVSLEFCDNMAAAMSAGKLVVARAGAGSIAEFARCGIIPILVPFPFSADNHQQENARHIEKNGAGIFIDQSKISGLLNEVLCLEKNSELANKMRSNLERIDEMNDMTNLVEDIEQAAKGISKK